MRMMGDSAQAAERTRRPTMNINWLFIDINMIVNSLRLVW